MRDGDFKSEIKFMVFSPLGAGLAISWLLYWVFVVIDAFQNINDANIEAKFLIIATIELISFVTGDLYYLAPLVAPKFNIKLETYYLILAFVPFLTVCSVILLSLVLGIILVTLLFHWALIGMTFGSIGTIVFTVLLLKTKEKKQETK